MTTNRPNCCFCHKSDSVIKHGYGPNGHQRFRCLACRRTFQVNIVTRPVNQEFEIGLLK
ncbi:IS1 family transposase [Vibrio cyclitrophicus]|uniref:IS1/IS1595 family N-terminal zinc-binding domain-containing protein n=1 Tax=Vibrio TaxID=662 RepID=UPI000D344FCB|nr:IS1 family transposase [Vibrio sp. OPT24]MCC5517324.1 IS1 family transposase [Vibrio splendidus]